MDHAFLVPNAAVWGPVGLLGAALGRPWGCLGSCRVAWGLFWGPDLETFRDHVGFWIHKGARIGEGERSATLLGLFCVLSGRLGIVLGTRSGDVEAVLGPVRSFGDRFGDPIGVLFAISEAVGSVRVPGSVKVSDF